ncbi:hypothetical protein BH23PLA1_BH23PLA1_18750 [soil metagenome]
MLQHGRVRRCESRIFRKFDGWWYAQFVVDGKRIQKKLVKGREQEEEAWRRFGELKAAPVSFKGSDLTVRLTGSRSKIS